MNFHKTYCFKQKMMKLDSTLFSCELLRKDKREYFHEIVIDYRKKCFVRLVVEEKFVT